MLWLTVALGTLGLALGLFEIPSYKLTALSGKCTGTLAGPLYIIKCEVPTQADEKCCGYSAVNRIVYPRSAFPTSFSMRCEHPSAIISCYVFYTEAAADAWAIGASPLPANGSYVAGCTAARDCRINGTFRTVAEATPTLAISIRSGFSAPQITFAALPDDVPAASPKSSNQEQLSGSAIAPAQTSAAPGSGPLQAQIDALASSCTDKAAVQTLCNVCRAS